MFQLAGQSDEIKYPVKVQFIDGNGKIAAKTFIAHFPRLSQSEIDDLVNRAKQTETSGVIGIDDRLTDDELARQVLVGWDDVTDEQGQPVEFSPIMRDKLLDIHPVRPTVIAAWFEQLAGGKRKN